MQQQLYMASNSQLIKTRRRRSHFLIPFAYVAFGIYAMMNEGQEIAATVMFVVALVWLVFYPKYSRWRYQRHFKSWINERHNDIIGKLIEMNVSEQDIQMSAQGSSSTIDWSEITDLICFEKQFLFLLKSGSSIIIAKNESYSDDEFISSVEKRGISIKDERSWEWK